MSHKNLSAAEAIDKDKTSTTLKPTTTTTTSTTASPPTTQAPTTTTPVPPPSDGTWFINGTNNIKCIVAKMAAQLSIVYLPQKAETAKQILIDVPENAIANGTCDGKKEEVMQLSWDFLNSTQSLTFHFVEMEKLYNLHHIQVQLDSKLFLNSSFSKHFLNFLDLILFEKYLYYIVFIIFQIIGDKNVILNHKTPQYNTSIGNSYRCLKLQTFGLEADSQFSNISGHLKMSNLQFQAFRSDNMTNFGAGKKLASFFNKKKYYFTLAIFNIKFEELFEYSTVLEVFNQ